MATIDLTVANTTTTAGSHASRRSVAGVYALKTRVTAAAAVAAKGSALAAADVIQAVDIPADTILIGGSAKVVTADSGTTLTVDIGTGGGDTIVDGGDATTAGWLAVGTNGKVSANGAVVSSADTLDLTIATASSAGDDWEIEVVAIVVDASPDVVPDSAFG